MGYRREPIAVGEWYHCYNRGIDKRETFESEGDCERFLQAMYLCNGEHTPGRSDFEHYQHARIFSIERGDPIVAIGAYCLMPNHFHILMQEIVEGGISRFMHRLGTSYTMYFNMKNRRTGNLFNKPFRSRLVRREGHFKYIAQYIHLNAAEIIDRDWKVGTKKSAREIERKLREYPYSSFVDYYGGKRLERSILDEQSLSVLKHGMSGVRTLVEDAIDYYSSLS